MRLLVIHELDHEDEENTVVGIASSVEQAEDLIDEYYGTGNYQEISCNEIDQVNIEYVKLFEIQSQFDKEPFCATICLEWFTLNEI